MLRKTVFAFLALSLSALTPAFGHGVPSQPGMHWAAIRAPGKEVRTKLVNAGFSIENIVEDMSYGYATPAMIERFKKEGYEVTASFAASEMRITDFPSDDSQFHNYGEMNAELDKLVQQYPNLVHKFSIGKSVEGRDIVGVRINPSARDGLSGSGLPGAFFMGGHHAREHLSMEMPLMLAQHLAANYGRDATITKLLDSRDVFLIPQINPDGAEYDISTGRYKSWRKNRRITGESCDGVDLNRNYGFHWGEGGSSDNSCSDVYMGKSAFSEPETQAVKAFVEGHPNIKTLLTFHTFSELILYPWGYTYDKLANAKDLSMFKTIADNMAGWNGYTAEPSSDLYITTGDTVDWAYGTLGITAFTFELSPKDMWFGGGGFYPGQEKIQPTFEANLKPALYLIDLADDPHRAVNAPQTTLFYGSQVARH
jgi:carboxypeptidase T